MLLEKKIYFAGNSDARGERHDHVTVGLVVDAIYHFLSFQFFSAVSFSRLFKLFKILSRILFSSSNAMSDDDRDNDLVIDLSAADDKALKNARERKRLRDIAVFFTTLRDALPDIRGNMQASQRLILKKAVNYIREIQKINSEYQQYIDDLRTRKEILEDRIRSELAKAMGNCAAAADILEATRISNSWIGAVPGFDGDSEGNSDNSDESKKILKKLKPN